VLGWPSSLRGFNLDPVMQKTKSKTKPNSHRKKAHPSAPLYAAIDLHSNNLFLAVIHATGERICCTKLPCDLPAIVDHLDPYKNCIQGIAVESTFNWYWLVDGLQAHGYPVLLANPAAIQQYDGLKHADDRTDAWFLAELLRLNILPCGYIYNSKTRPVRDLLRRRADWFDNVPRSSSASKTSTSALMVAPWTRANSRPWMRDRCRTASTIRPTS
jgi:hypothetical protein